VLVSCAKKEPSLKEVVTQYYKAFDAGDFNEIKSLINDSITVISGDYSMPYDKSTFYNKHFKWDSIFQTDYNVVNVAEQNDQIIANVTLSSIRNRFLGNNSMTCGYRIFFIDHKISKIQELECENADWDAWQKNRDSLVSWTATNHPELNGFIYDMSMQGAINYLQAIAYYNNR